MPIIRTEAIRIYANVRAESQEPLIHEIGTVLYSYTAIQMTDSTML